MRQFNLEEALRGAKVITRGGGKVTKIRLVDRSAMFPLSALIGRMATFDYTMSGHYNYTEEPHLLDLMMANEQILNVGDNIQFLYDCEILEGKVTHVLQNNRVIARSNGSNPVFANVGMYDVCTINKDDNE